LRREPVGAQGDGRQLVGGVHQDPVRELIAIGFPASSAAFGSLACTTTTIPLPAGPPDLTSAPAPSARG